MSFVKICSASHIFKGVENILKSFVYFLIDFSEILYRSLNNVVEHLRVS